MAATLVERLPASKRFHDLTGRKFGQLVVLSFAGFQARMGKWKCRCSCGSVRDYFKSHLTQRAGHCGCLSKTGGRTSHPLYRTWYGMIDRCHNKDCPAFKNYGHRGISVCQRWRDSFWDFVSDVGGRPSERHSLDRFPDNNGNYEPGNVRWATAKQQGRNTRFNRIVTANGESLTATEWAERIGISREALRRRLDKIDESDERAVAIAIYRPAEMGNRISGRRTISDGELQEWIRKSGRKE